MVVIADSFGHGTELRDALVELLAVADRVDTHESMRLRLLRDLRTVFEGGGWQAAMSTERIIKGLCAIEEGPWARYYGRVVEPKDIADLLKQYEVSPKPVKVRLKSGKAATKRGYRRVELEDAWERYLRLEAGDGP